MSDAELRACEHAYRETADAAEGAALVRAAERLGRLTEIGLRLTFFPSDQTTRYLWRCAMVRAGLGEGAGLETGDVLEGPRKLRARHIVRWRVIALTERRREEQGKKTDKPGGRVTVLQVRAHGAPVPPEMLDIMGTPYPLQSERTGNRGAKWMGRLVEPMDPARRRVLLPVPTGRVSERREACRETVRGVLANTWCLGDSEAQTRAYMTQGRWVSSGAIGWDSLAWWTEVKAATGWLSTREKRAQDALSAEDIEQAIDKATTAPADRRQLKLFTRKAP